MESNLPNQNQIDQKVNTFESSQSQNQISTKQVRSNKFPTWLILIFIVSMFGVIGLFAYQNSKLRQQLANVQESEQPPTNTKIDNNLTSIPTPKSEITNKLPSPVPTLPPEVSEDAPVWQTQKITINKETSFAGKTSLELSLKYSEGWQFSQNPRDSSTNNLITNCTDYTFSKQGGNEKLTISPICTSWSATYSNIPSDAKIITSQENMGNDGHTSYLIRFFDTTLNGYSYQQVAVSQGKSLDLNTDQMADAMMKEFQNDALTFKVTLTNPAKNQTVFDIADEMVVSLLTQ